MEESSVGGGISAEPVSSKKQKNKQIIKQKKQKM